MGVLLIGISAAMSFGSSCGAPRRESVVSTRTTTVERSVVQPPPMVDISIVNLHDEPYLDPAMEKVVGTVINHGDKPVSRLSIRVDALSAGGRLVHSATTPPLPQTIAPFGGQATFEAFVPRSPAVTTYHAVAIAR